ncbi:hypothetical protein [Acinetobacter venetianus]|uniref:hypothetical protein n=1 Tax=Acinetobacter venetianus TaxID=52133 RepID=UPI0007756409|nr:hypothetical protein [Acinetobacter venetianus]KXO75281.1 hypothetical protein AYL20_10040 [Acinetobacter venetianus]MCR4531804.1 urea transporter [Acinetobacter venetianus]MDA0695668.1 hypothetical protein [Pseudomonadota bacterium]MDA1253057.1 hypothetical protein [Pseudomonadota bacterium]
MRFDSELLQIKGKISDIRHMGKKPFHWYKANSSLINQSYYFEVSHFLAYIDGYPLKGGFTDCTFYENDIVEVVILKKQDEKCYEVLALLSSKNILHIAPFLHPKAPRINENQDIPRWVLNVSGLVMIVTWLGLHSIAGFFLGMVFAFFVLVCIALGWMVYVKTWQGDYDAYQLRSELFKMPMLQNIDYKRIGKEKYWYRMKEYVIDIKLLPNK